MKTKKDYAHIIKCAIPRAVRTFCQTAIATIGTASLMSDVNWAMVCSASALAALLSVLTSIVSGLPEAENIEVIGGEADA